LKTTAVGERDPQPITLDIGKFARQIQNKQESFQLFEESAETFKLRRRRAYDIEEQVRLSRIMQKSKLWNLDFWITSPADGNPLECQRNLVA
jgi:hypothetical protein